MTNELATLKKEVEKLKIQKKQKVALATTTQERDKLLKEISQLEAIKKSPSALKKFGNTYLRGLKTTGRTLWRGIKRASRNLETNAPEFREMSRGMVKGSQMQPYSPMAKMYVPKASPHYATTPRKMKAPKMKKKRKQVKKMKRKSYSKRPSKPKSQMAWDMP